MRTATKRTKTNTTIEKKPQAQIAVGESHRDYINELVKEFQLKNTTEATELIVTAAKLHRFGTNAKSPHDIYLDIAEKIKGSRQTRKTQERIESLRAELKKLEELEKRISA